MESYNIVNIQEIETFKKGESYKGEITVFTSDIGPKFLLFGNKSVYLNAFSYMLVLSGRATLLVDSVEYPIDAHSLCILSPLHLTNFRQVSRDFQCLCLCSRKQFHRSPTHSQHPTPNYPRDEYVPLPDRANF